MSAGAQPSGTDRSQVASDRRTERGWSPTSVPAPAPPDSPPKLPAASSRNAMPGAPPDLHTLQPDWWWGSRYEA